jgi:hypothetical protein
MATGLASRYGGRLNSVLMEIALASKHCLSCLTASLSLNVSSCVSTTDSLLFAPGFSFSLSAMTMLPV